MTPTAYAQRTAPSRPAIRRHAAVHERASRVQSREQAEVRDALAGELLAAYLDGDGRRREVLRCLGAGGSVLVVDCDSATLGDRRLIAHLAPDEPAGNAELACAIYMRTPSPSACRRVAAEDLSAVPTSELEAQAMQDPGGPSRLEGPSGECFALELVCAEMSIPELRWCRYAVPGGELRPVSLREVVGSLESYEPVRTLSARALLGRCGEHSVSITTLRSELQRLNTSRTVLNRGLRETVLSQVRRGIVSMSEVALRCERVKRDPRGTVSGETSWLARRLGLAAEAPGVAPTPWIHSDVLALIARSGLGVSPREVEVA